MLSLIRFVLNKIKNTLTILPRVVASSARITKLYKKEDLLNKQVICVTNFPPRQIADFISEVLTTGFVSDNREVVLAMPERKVPNGMKLL